MPAAQSILFTYSREQVPFLTTYKRLIQKCMGVDVRLYSVTFSCDTALSAAAYEKLAKSYTWCVTSSPSISFGFRPQGASHDDCAGSVFGGKHLVIQDLQQLFSVPEGPFLVERYLDKVFRPHKFIAFPQFTWARIDTAARVQEALADIAAALLIACDIETLKANRAISCDGFAVLLPGGIIRTYVIDCADPDFFPVLQALAASPAPKVFQNGLYDNLYLLRWNLAFRNWAWDTAYAFHSWYAELPKSLGFLSAFFLRDFEYWKAEGKTAANKEEYHRYNAKDCYTTLCIALAQLVEMPAWAKENFYINFPMVFPCLMMNAQGLAVNQAKRKAALDAAEIRFNEREKRLQLLTATPTFNAGSPQQVNKLLSCFGLPAGTEEKNLLVHAAINPILDRLMRAILDVREDKKAISQYFDPELWHDRLFFNMHPAHTDTSRFACQKSSFWCGAQIQNFPPYAKVYIEADEGYEFVEIDNEQSETRCTAYLAEDTALIETVESGKDFHALNATKFFGVPYEVAKQKLPDGSDSVPRAMAKKINHAVSYNMGAKMFVAQAGSKFMSLARSELHLPIYYSDEEVAGALIAIFDKNYPRVRHQFQDQVKREIAFTKRIRSPDLVGKWGWTRWFFKDPATTKPALNAAVAHGPQSLSVRIVNEGLLKIYQEVCFLPDRPVKMVAQVHDSILFQIRVGQSGYWIPKLQEYMRTPVLIKGRELIIPTAAKVTGKFWGKERKA